MAFPIPFPRATVPVVDLVRIYVRGVSEVYFQFQSETAKKTAEAILTRMPEIGRLTDFRPMGADRQLVCGMADTWKFPPSRTSYVMLLLSRLINYDVTPRSIPIEPLADDELLPLNSAKKNSPRIAISRDLLAKRTVLPRIAE